MNVNLRAKQSYKTCFVSIVKIVKEIFPFENKNAFSVFQKYIKAQNKKLKYINNNEDFFVFVKKTLAGLKNSHTKLGGYPWKTYKPLNYGVILIKNKFYLKQNNKIIGEIFAVDNKPPKTILEKAIEMISGSTNQYLASQGLKFILTNKKKSIAKTKIKINNKIVIKNLKRQLIKFKQKHFCAKRITSDIVYFKIPAWRNIGTILEQKTAFFIKNGAKILILDLRGNMGGSSAESDIFSSHFFKNKTLFGTEKQRISNKNLKLKKRYYFIKPKKPYWNIPIILIVNSECFSSNESFIAGMKDNKKALVIGETTGGGTGNPKSFSVGCENLSLKIFVSTWNYQRINGQFIEGIGIKPDILVKPNLDNLLKKEDVVLKKAIIEAKKII